ncbi:MAG: adenylyltransferase/cytidyltransferase family protein [Patescibacteria group bacterium]
MHPGHAFYLAEAKKHGEKLITIIATDANVLKIKGRQTFHAQSKRRDDIAALGISDIVEIGDEHDPYKCLRTYEPSTICLGYDQHGFTEGLTRFLDTNFPNTKIIRIDGHATDIHKSSKLRAQLEADPSSI